MNKFLITLISTAIITILLISFVFFNFFIKNLTSKNILIEIPKESNLTQISNLIKNNKLTLNKYFPYSLSIILNYENKLSYGEFLVTKNDTLYTLLKKIRYNDIYYRKFTIIEGYEYYQFNNLIRNSKLTLDKYDLNKYSILADTYSYYNKQNTSSFLNDLNKFTLNFFEKNKKSKMLKFFDIDEIIIISSLVEKEAKNDYDRRLISSVIFNRIAKNMKLDIDATVIYSITKGNYKLDRKLTYDDLKIDSKFNTYKNKGLPPVPICFPGIKTTQIVLEGFESPYYYYYFDKLKNSHIFSKSYKEHLIKLNEYKKNL